MIWNKLYNLFYKLFNLIRERFFLIPATTEPPSRPFSALEEGLEGIESPQSAAPAQKQPSDITAGKGKSIFSETEKEQEIPPILEHQHISLCETLDRVLNTGVVIHGDITISVANIDLIYIGLKALITSVETARKMQVGS